MYWSFSFSISCSNESIQDWFPLGWTGLISLQSKGLPRVFTNTTVGKNVRHIVNGHLLRKKMYLCNYLQHWYLELCYKSRAWAFSPLILIGKHQVGTVSGPHFTEKELTSGSLGEFPKVTTVGPSVRSVSWSVKERTLMLQDTSHKSGQPVFPRTWSRCGCSLLRDQKHQVDPAKLNLLHLLQLGGQPVTAGPQNEDFREGYLLGLRAKVIFKSGLARWGAIRIDRSFSPYQLRRRK